MTTPVLVKRVRFLDADGVERVAIGAVCVPPVSPPAADERVPDRGDAVPPDAKTPRTVTE